MYDPNARLKAQKSEQRKMLLFFGFVAAFFLFFNWSEREDFTVSDAECEVLNHLWSDKYQQDFSFSDNWAAAPFECNSKQSGMVRALKFIDDLDGDAGEQTNQFSFYQWARSQKPVFNKQLLFSLMGRTLFADRTIIISDGALIENNPVAVAGILVHELRHLEQRFNSHVPCLSDPKITCDAKLEPEPETGGAYSFNMYFYHHIRQSANASRFEKKLARKQMQVIFDKRFNQVPAGSAQKFDLNDPA